MNRRIHVQALYVTKLGRTYRSEVRIVDEGQELFDFEQELKYQLYMKDYVIEFTNQHGHKQFIQPADLETIIAAQLGWEAAVAPTEETLESIPESKETGPYSWVKNVDPSLTGHISVDPANNQGIVFIQPDEQGKFNAHLPFPEPPVVKVHVKPTTEQEADGEKTQEIPLPSLGPNAVARKTFTNNPQDPTRTAAYGSVRVRLGAGTDPDAPTP